jgi:signal peptidase II
MNKFKLKTYKFYIAITLFIAIFFISDRYLKILSSANFSHSAFNLISDFFTFTFTPNYFIAFSLPFSGPWLNIFIGLIIIILITYLVYCLKKEINYLLIIGLSLIILGAISNFMDRLTYGYVIDYFYLRHFTIFNLADVGISVGALLSLVAINKKPS